MRESVARIGTGLYFAVFGLLVGCLIGMGAGFILHQLVALLGSGSSSLGVSLWEITLAFGATLAVAGFIAGFVSSSSRRQQSES